MDLARAAFVAANLAGVGFLIALGAIALVRGPRRAYLRLWSAFCFVGALYLGAATAAGQASSPAVALVFVRLAFSSASLALFAFFCFALLFIRVRDRVAALVALVWVVVLQPVFWLTDTVVAGVTASEFSRYAPVAGPAMGFYIAYVVYGWAAPLVWLVRAFRHNTGLRRTQLAYLLAAFAVLFAATVGSLMPAWLGSQTLAAVFPALLLPVALILVTYAVIRHRLWDIRTILHRTAVWGILSVGLLLPLYGIFRAATALELDLRPAELAFVLTVLFLAAHIYLRALHPRLDRIVQRRAFDRAEALARFSRDMAGLGRPDQVAEHVLETLGDTVVPEQPEVWCHTGAEWLRVTASGTEIRATGPVPCDHPFVAYLAEKTAAIDRSQIEVDPALAPVRAHAEEYFAECGAEVCMPLVHASAVVGLVHVGSRKNLRPYTRDDLEFLERLGAAASIGLSNAQLFERVDRQRRDLEELTSSLERRVRERTSELEAAHEELSTAYQGLQQLDQLKSRFFANISHELRTPLTLILAPLQALLAADTWRPEVRDELERIQRRALELLKLIEDLLDLSRLEEARLRLDLKRVSLGGFAARLVDYARPLARRKEVEVTLEVEGEPAVEADEGMLERVLVNLLTNALKFTDPGGQVSVRVSERSGRGLIEVQDDGIGIPASERHKIFDRFHQVDGPGTRRSGGTGIGLALARELVELHNGELSVHSEEGAGSTFTVSIPRTTQVPERLIDRRATNVSTVHQRRESDGSLGEWLEAIKADPRFRFLDLEAATERRLVPRSEPGRRRSARLLTVDDNPEILRYLHSLLDDRFELWPVQDGERAWELLLRQRHDLVITDSMMPGLSGLDLCRRIKNDPRTQDTPVILLTARGDTEHKVDGHGAGADTYLTKPFEHAELLAAIRALLAGRTRRAEVASRRRAASLETLLAGMAHELRNACHQIRSAHSVMSELTQRALDAAGDAGTLRGRVEKMDAISRRALTRISTVVDSLQRYCRNRLQPAWDDLNLDDLVARQIDLLETGARGVTLDASLDSLAVVRGPTEELRQMVVNLVENALQAAPPGGRVEIETSASAGKATLRVRDDGPGIAPDVLDRVFDPFFTTKSPGEGMGLGLSLCKRTVSDVGGTIEIHTREGGGTEVEVVLPATSDAEGVRAHGGTQ